MVLGYFGFGHIIYVSLLFTNAIAILNEERFLAKSEFIVLESFALLIMSLHSLANLYVSRRPASRFLIYLISRMVDPKRSERQRWIWRGTP
jgi:hypothetical protein